MRLENIDDLIQGLMEIREKEGNIPIKRVIPIFHKNPTILDRLEFVPIGSIGLNVLEDYDGQHFLHIHAV